MRVPAIDWPGLVVGEKRQLRVLAERAPSVTDEQLPLPIVGYVRDRVRTDVYRDAALFVLDSLRIEPLLAISADDVHAEGFASIEEYRRYWNAHRDGGFRPLAKVARLELRPFTAADHDEMARHVLDHLYGPWLDAVHSR